MLFVEGILQTNRSSLSQPTVSKHGSKDYVHCFYCPPCKCEDPDGCLVNETLRRKCPAAMRHDNLKRHCETHHGGKPKRAVGDPVFGNIAQMFQVKQNVSQISTVPKQSEKLSPCPTSPKRLRTLADFEPQAEETAAVEKRKAEGITR